MLPNRYYPVLESEALRGKPVAVERLGQPLVLWRDGEGVAHAFVDRCPHRGVKLSLGRVHDGQLVCRYHGFRFDGGGACTHLPCEGSGAHVPRGLEVDGFDLIERHGLLWLWWGERSVPDEERPAIPWFEQIPDHTRHASGSAMAWPANIVRTLESNFDLHHGPWLHDPIIPRTRSRVDPIACLVDGEHLTVKGALRKDDGTPADAPGGLPFEIQFLPPSLTWFRLAKGITFVVADCPIDAHHTWRYARYYNELLPLPGLGKLIAWALLTLEWSFVQKRQDLPVVVTQSPPRYEPGCDKLVRADVGIARFLKLYRRLRDEALEDPALPAFLREATLALGMQPQPPPSSRSLCVLPDEPPQLAHA
jgi:phenylpropionate dioxygenase-like ring-hydroxylating dioxygenase large terminal subunit